MKKFNWDSYLLWLGMFTLLDAVFRWPNGKVEEIVVGMLFNLVLAYIVQLFNKGDY